MAKVTHGRVAWGRGDTSWPGDVPLWDDAIHRSAVDRETLLTEPSKGAVETLAERMSRRPRGALIRNDFVCGDEGRRPPLSHLVSMRGRGGGEIPLKLYLALLWVSSGGEHTTEFEAAHWSQVLALPSKTGARRVRKAIASLVNLGLIDAKERPGRATVVTLLHDSGSGKPYTIPKGRGSADRYFSIAPSLWTKGLIQNLTTAGLAMLLILTEEVRGQNRPQWWSPSAFDARFHISQDTRTKGFKELVDRKLVVERSLVVSPNPSKKSRFDETRRRKAYMLINEAKL